MSADFFRLCFSTIPPGFLYSTFPAFRISWCMLTKSFSSLFSEYGSVQERRQLESDERLPSRAVEMAFLPFRARSLSRFFREKTARVWPLPTLPGLWRMPFSFFLCGQVHFGLRMGSSQDNVPPLHPASCLESMQY